MISLKRFLSIIILFTSICSFSQSSATVFGKVTDDNNQALEFVNISIKGQDRGVISNQYGHYEIKIPANTELVLLYSFIGFERKEVKISLADNSRRELNIQLKVVSTELPDFVIVDEQLRESGLTKIDPLMARVTPGISGEIEDVIKTLPGVSSNNEMSSQYSVRGGNYDENLVYVNGIEIYRPFLIRSGQQEGLSFVNSDLISSILFSAGGFDAKYGDKMSSVLDISYKRPNANGGSASLSLLNAKVHFEGVSKNNRLSFLVGLRHKSNQYVLQGLDTKGDYKPSFSDVQAYVDYQINDEWKLSFLGNIATNVYNLKPTDRDTRFGTVNQAYRLQVYFDGQEMDSFKTQFGAISANYQPSPNMNISFTASAFKTVESETFDIQGQYWIGQLESNFGSDEFGDVIESQGVGTHLTHARNFLKARVASFEHKGQLFHDNQFLQWGFKFQHEYIDDRLSEWEMVDSAYFSIPNPLGVPGDPNAQVSDLELYKSTKAQINLKSNRVSGFMQNKWSLNDEKKLSLNAGIRFNYWDFNEQFLISPRMSISYKPAWKKDILLRFATGYYYQPPFYKEIRDFNGLVNPNIKAQKSIHFVSSADWNFKAWERPFKFTAALYYKYLDDLIPYKIDNVRIRYLADNIAKGYATGIDLKVNGEFVKGIESWASLSVMKTEEDIDGDFFWNYFDESGLQIDPSLSNIKAVDSIRVEPGYIPRPTDQRFSFSLFFQDYLPKNPSYKMHLRLVFGSRLPFGPPNSEKYEDVLRIPPYKRVDIGFSKQIIDDKSKFAMNNPLKYLKSLWITAEVFNLFQINNTISYLWIKDVNNRQYAIPNYLTPRQINVKIIAQF
jgi:hypothetical protein